MNILKIFQVLFGKKFIFTLCFININENENENSNMMMMLIMLI
jgi:hypothetical protein